ncbi:MAG: Maf family protein, partial [Candidatus Omnitrophica bacterium]|nr:Maf family protein [Candidatus Omnitrophota bacterium]
MRKIILASGSKARREILREMGLKFTVVRSGAKESRKIKGSCGKLVMDNALRKACEVARRFDSGIVIAADTVVMAGRKII